MSVVRPTPSTRIMFVDTPGLRTCPRVSVIGRARDHPRKCVCWAWLRLNVPAPKTTIIEGWSPVPSAGAVGADGAVGAVGAVGAA
eukprot:911432-Alexandrium_andersonii.AAC.1